MAESRDGQRQGPGDTSPDQAMPEVSNPRFQLHEPQLCFSPFDMGFLSLSANSQNRQRDFQKWFCL